MKLTHEELCELWTKIENCNVRQFTWFWSVLVVDPLVWTDNALRNKIKAWRDEMRDRYGQDED